MSNVRKEIRLLALGLEDGVTEGFVCPFCNADHEKSFYITRDATLIKFYFHRASCGAKGILNDNYYVVSREVNKKQFEPKSLYKETEGLSEDLIAYFSNKYDISRELLSKNGVYYVPANNAFGLPIFDTISSSPMGNYLKRLPSEFRTQQFDHELPRKAMLYWDKPPTGCYIPNGCSFGDSLVLVEDPLSAMKVSQIMPCASLLGVHLSQELAVKLRQYGVRQLIWMLDPDAQNKAIGQAETYAFLFGNKVIGLDKDPKDTPIEVLREVL